MLLKLLHSGNIVRYLCNLDYLKCVSIPKCYHSTIILKAVSSPCSLELCELGSCLQPHLAVLLMINTQLESDWVASNPMM